ncbi:MAG: DEAD/DEAH box helicase [Candidatus Methanoplasma sp.]|nr:DEAD/DEAH box helicase [Candidatus Methanoplasma sp.]
MTEPTEEWTPDNRKLAEQYRYYVGLNTEERTVVDRIVSNVWIPQHRDDIDHMSGRMASGKELSGKGVSEDVADTIINECLMNGIVTKTTASVTVDTEFALLILPFIDRRSHFGILSKGCGRSGLALSDVMCYLRTFLDRDGISDDEYEEISCDLGEALMQNQTALQMLSNVLEYPYYTHLLPLMNPDLLDAAIRERFERDLEAVKDVRWLACTAYGKSHGLPAVCDALQGDFRTMVADGKIESDRMFAAASMMFLTEDDDAGAAECFDKGMRPLRSSAEGADMPTFPLWMLYCICLHMKLEPFEYGPVLGRVHKALIKYTYGRSNSLHIVCECLLGRSESYLHDMELNLIVRSKNAGLAGLFATVAMYIIECKINDDTSDRISENIDAARKNGYSAIALEAAYALKKMNNRRDIAEMYEEIREDVGFEPALSHFRILEKWALNLDKLVMMLSSEVGAAKTSKSAVRLAYEVYPDNWAVQPVLQKWKVKGGWSNGRRVALRDIRSGHAEGMTEQDLRAGKCIVPSNDWRYDLVEKGTIFKELAGHPNLFLRDTGIPLELVSGQPDIVVERTARGYEIGTDIVNSRDGISLIQETNTRYKVVDLNEKQMNVISAIRDSKIIVPEEGAEKLAHTVKVLSSFATVHSDLAQDSEDAEIVEPDSRIRVQILPAGLGMKAELFIKPFGDRPPYLKPGMGGRTVVCNHDGKTFRANRNLELERSRYDALMAEIQPLESVSEEGGLITIEDPMDSLDILEVLKRHEDISVTEWPEGERFKIFGAADFPDLSLRLDSGSNWFDLEGDLNVDGEKVMTFRELLSAAAKSKRRFVELGKGEFIALSKQLKRQLDQLYAVADTKDGIRLNRFAAASVGELMDSVESLRNDAVWADLRAKIKGKVEEDVPPGLNGELRPYQADGFRWMARLSTWGAGACLADDMGLGKTVQAICMLLRDSRSGPGLVVSPVSVIPNWINEVRKFAPGLNPVTLPADDREGAMSSLHPGDVLITSYGLLQSEEKLFASREWSVAILDEAHSIKNYATKTSRAAMSIRASFRLILTGTPVQNNLSEAWSLFNFINPGMLGPLSSFSERFISKGEEGRAHLKKLIAPFILRRTKSSVLDELPPKTEIVKKICLTEDEAAFYEAVRLQAVERLDSGDDATGNMRVLAEITRLRQASCNPRLVDPNSGIRSSKMSAFMDIVRELAGAGHRSLVFSQFVTHLNLAREELNAEGINYLYLDGSTPVSERGRLVDRFQSGEATLFLISLKAGGLGLNLTGADFVIHLDPWWNPAVEDQASDRAHRIGQTRPVTVYRLVGENTIEEKIIRLHSTKRDLADSLLEGSDKVAGMSVKELRKLIEDA